MLSIVTEAGDWICGRIGAELSARIPGVEEGCPRRLYVPYYLLAQTTACTGTSRLQTPTTASR